LVELRRSFIAGLSLQQMILYLSPTSFVELTAMRAPLQWSPWESRNRKQSLQWLNSKSPDSMPPPFLRALAWAEESSNLRRRIPSFPRGDPADSVVYLQKGHAKVTVVSAAGKEDTITLFSAGDFVGEE
jgi:CRP-like cAMP-binding protein